MSPRLLLSALVAVLLAAPALAQPALVAGGLTQPFGVALAPDGTLYVVQQGTGAADASVSIVTPGGDVYPFLTGLQSAVTPEGQVAGVWHLLLDGDDIWIATGLGFDFVDSYLLRISTAGFTPGDPPRTVADLDVNQDVGAFVVTEEGYEETNLYNLTLGPGGDLFLVDAGANIVLRRDAASGALSVFAELPATANPTPIGPPFIDPVPTGIVYTGDGFLVSALTGFPFLTGLGRIFRVELDGTVSLYRDGFAPLVDIDLDPTDGRPVVLEFATFLLAPPPTGGWQPGTGAIKKVQDGPPETLASGLNLPAGLAFRPDGTLYFTSLFGQLFRLSSRDTTAPVCGPIRTEQQNGYLTAIVSSAADPESGIARVVFRTLRNLRGYAGPDAGSLLGPYSQGEEATFDPAATPSVALRAERVGPGGGAFVARVYNGEGLWRDCDPVVSELSATAPEAFSLEAPYPNPARTGEPVRVAFGLAEAAPVRVAVYDLVGREVARLVDAPMEAGRYEVAWDGRDAAQGALAAGVYVVRMEAGAFAHALRVTVMP